MEIPPFHTMEQQNSNVASQEFNQSMRVPKEKVVYALPAIDFFDLIYRAGATAWNTLIKKFAKSNGRATRFEYFSFCIVMAPLLYYFVKYVLLTLLQVVTFADYVSHRTESLIFQSNISGLTRSYFDIFVEALGDAIEYYVTNLIPALYVIIFMATLIPFICVGIRRMHDINKSGWWIIVPFAGWFLQFKKSDEGANKYGMPEE